MNIDDDWFDDDLDRGWQAGVLMAMTYAITERDDPDEFMSTWFDEAGEGDEQHLNWAMRKWRRLRNKSVLDVETLRALVRWEIQRLSVSDPKLGRLLANSYRTRPPDLEPGL